MIQSDGFGYGSYGGGYGYGYDDDDGLSGPGEIIEVVRDSE